MTEYGIMQSRNQKSPSPDRAALLTEAHPEIFGIHHSTFPREALMKYEPYIASNGSTAANKGRILSTGTFHLEGLLIFSKSTDEQRVLKHSGDIST